MFTHLSCFAVDDFCSCAEEWMIVSKHSCSKTSNISVQFPIMPSVLNMLDWKLPPAFMLFVLLVRWNDQVSHTIETQYSILTSFWMES